MLKRPLEDALFFIKNAATIPLNLWGKMNVPKMKECPRLRLRPALSRIRNRTERRSYDPDYLPIKAVATLRALR
jgi:hypothetical protein